ncbi:hypothetical protein YPPY52_1983, partial [Yersinia pestis PY-52]
MASNFCRE